MQWKKQLFQFSIKKDSVSGFYSWCLECSRQKDAKRTKVRKDYSENDTKNVILVMITRKYLKISVKNWGQQMDTLINAKMCTEI